jgi:hypothetical protein
VRAQDHARLVFDKKRVLHVARRMVFGHIERVKVVPLVLQARPLAESEAHIKEDAVSLADKARNGVDMAPLKAGWL